MLRNPKVYHLVLNLPLLASVLSQMKPVHTPSYLSKIHFNTIPHLSLDLPSRLFLSDVPTKTWYAFLFTLMHGTCPMSFMLLVLMQKYITMKLFGHVQIYVIFVNATDLEPEFVFYNTVS
jgi:hypothetical protein